MAQDSVSEEAEPTLPSLAKGETAADKKTKPRGGKPGQQRNAKIETAKQMTLGLEKPGKKTGKKNGGKKSKK